MNKIRVFSIGKITNQNDDAGILLDAKYVPALKGLQGYSHVQIVWWMDRCDNETDRAVLTEEKPYTKGP
ncbi:MAG: tRNA (N6-threonylcarbamoyladenosine(37)-N6)-methyltransferase TrmO, partial [Lachnospiraceae bacterium]